MEAREAAAAAAAGEEAAAAVEAAALWRSQSTALFTEEALALALSLALAAAVAAAAAAGARVAAALAAVSAPEAPQMGDCQGNPGSRSILLQCTNWSLVHRRNSHL